MGVSVKKSTKYCREIFDWYADCKGLVRLLHQIQCAGQLLLFSSSVMRNSFLSRVKRLCSNIVRSSVMEVASVEEFRALKTSFNAQLLFILLCGFSLSFHFAFCNDKKELYFFICLLFFLFCYGNTLSRVWQ